MAWREITQADVEGVMSAPELSAYQAAAIATGQDPMADAIATITDQARGYIADNPANSLAAGATIPERCLLPALHLIRVEILTRVDMEVSRDRADAKRDAIRFFERVADGKITVEQPTGELDTEPSSAPAMTLTNSRPRIAGRENLSGL
jgi:hypothetical protein